MNINQERGLISFALVMMLLLSSGCASLNNLSFLAYKAQPEVRVEKSPLLNNHRYSTICAISIAQVKNKPWTTGITQSQISSFVANLFNAIGYSVVDDLSKADLVIAVDALTQDTSYYIPPFQYQVPKYVPPQTIDIYSNQYGNIYGSGGYPQSSFSGYYYGNSQTRITLPGYTTTQTVLYPGEFVKQYGHTVQLFVYDNKTGNCVYSATGYATSAVNDVRIASQILFSSCMAQFPPCPNPYWSKPVYRNKYYLGISYVSLTIDGNNYFPTVLGEINKSAAKAGLKDRDIITAINGQSVVNMFDEQVFQLLCSNTKGAVNVTVYRNGVTKSLFLPLESTVQQFFRLN